MFNRVLALLLLLLSASAWAADDGLVPVPALSARVTDLTQTLSPAQRDALEQKLAAFEKQKGSQVAVLIVPSTQPEAIEQYSIRVTDQWKLGRMGVDDGLLLLVAKNDHRLRIEVGRGLEGALPDAIAKRIIAETITPYFRNGDFAGGINAGIDQVISVINGEALPPPAPARQAGDGDSRLGAVLLPFFVLWGFGHILKRALGTFPASGVVGVGTGVVAFVVLGSLGLAAVVAVASMFMSLVMYSGAVGGMPIGYGGGGGGFGGGLGGGFGGGGGGFSGGGASGGW